MNKKTTLLMGKVNTTHDIISLATKITELNIKKFETYSPFPIHGMDNAMKLKDSKLAWLSLIGGLTGVFIGFGLQIWTSAIDYKIVVSGKEFNSIPAFFPVGFELTILLTAFATVIGMFVLNGLPQLNHAVFEHPTFSEVTDDAFFISIDTTDKNYNREKVLKIFDEHKCLDIQEVINE